MNRRDAKSLLVTGGFLIVLTSLIAAGLAPANRAPEPVLSPELEHYQPDAQFVQYLEYRAHLENSNNCQ
jgi:hypothetical protein